MPLHILFMQSTSFFTLFLIQQGLIVRQDQVKPLRGDSRCWKDNWNWRGYFKFYYCPKVYKEGKILSLKAERPSKILSQPKTIFTHSNKFIMKVNRQRNPYLKRIFSQTPHKYSFDLESGKYYLLDEKGNATDINPNGTFRPKFRSNYSGFVNHKTRYLDSPNDPSVLHFAPDPEPHTPYHNPVPDKFSGYAQFPYQLTPHIPTYLKRPNDPEQPHSRRKAQSLILDKGIKLERQSKQKKSSNSAILQYSMLKGTNQDQKQYFNSAWSSMSITKPLPKQKKKTCYNYRCKYLKQWVFDEKGKLQNIQATDPLKNTLVRSFHDGALTQEMQQSKLLSTMALSGIA